MDSFEIAAIGWVIAFAFFVLLMASIALESLCHWVNDSLRRRRERKADAAKVASGLRYIPSNYANPNWNRNVWIWVHKDTEGAKRFFAEIEAVTPPKPEKTVAQKVIRFLEVTGVVALWAGLAVILAAFAVVSSYFLGTVAALVIGGALLATHAAFAFSVWKEAQETQA